MPATRGESLYTACIANLEYTTSMCKTRGISHQSGHSEHHNVKTVCHLPYQTGHCNYTVSQNGTYFVSDVQESISIIFGKSITEKVPIVKLLYFPTSPN